MVPGAVIRCRAIGLLRTEDESGDDPKLICVPHTKLDRRFADTNSVDDLPALFKDQLEQFYAHYKNLEAGKWVKTNGWGDADEAKDVIREGLKNYK